MSLKMLGRLGKSARGGEAHLLEGIHPKGNAHSRAVGEEGSQGCLFKEAKYQDLVPKEEKKN